MHHATQVEYDELVPVQSDAEPQTDLAVSAISYLANLRVYPPELKGFRPQMARKLPGQ
jgi:hypothetical protein